MVVDWRLSWTVCRDSAVRSLQWTRRWCVPFTATVPRTTERRTQTAWFSFGRRKERRYPELVGPDNRARLFVSGCLEVGLVSGNQQRRARSSLSWRRRKFDGNHATCRREPSRLGGCGGGVTLSCAAAKAVATCLLDLKCAQGSDGDTPLWEVEADHHQAGLAA